MVSYIYISSSSYIHDYRCICCFVFQNLTVGHLAAEVVGSCDLPAKAGYLVCNCNCDFGHLKGWPPKIETVRVAEASFCWSLFLGQSWKPQHAKCLGKEPLGLCRIGVLHVKKNADRRVMPPADLNNSDESRPIKLVNIKSLYQPQSAQFPQ